MINPVLQKNPGKWYSTISAELGSDNAVVAKVTTDSQSPWFSGHFPDDPILPGVAQLHMVVASIAKVLQQELVLQRVARIKFRKIIRPGNVLTIHAEAGKNENHYSFHITSEQQEVCSGRLVLAPKKEQ
jgi:3-hydroxymyristoyl/3-hydroxydecanoyl-(acyl carrier protein) dehydratase